MVQATFQARHEMKIPLNAMDRFVLEKRLRSGMICDPNGIDGRYMVRSLYFDDPQDSAAWDKLDGVYERKKYRLRFYNSPDSPILLECKHKVGSLSDKTSVRLTREQAEKLISGDVGCLQSYQDRMCQAFVYQVKAGFLRPKTIVEYDRTAFIYDLQKVRITIDDAVRSGMSSIDFFDPELLLGPVLNQGMCVLEVKYDQFLPQHIAHLIQIDSRRQMAHSKYVMCRAFC